MTYVITEPCIDVKDKASVEVCPVDCIYEGPTQLFKLYALDTALALPPRRLKAELLKASAGHILVRVDLIGRYQRT